MEIINNRYKILDLYKEDNKEVTYKAIDLIDSNRTIFLNIINNISRIKDHFTKNFIYFCTINNSLILRNYTFSIINSIDNKKVKKNKYFYTTEFFEGTPIVNYSKKFSSKDILIIFSKLCIISDYLFFRGISKEYIHPNNILISDKDITCLKIKDIASVTFEIVTNKYNSYFEFSRTPEMIKSSNFSSNYEYIYSLGRVLEYMLSNENYNNIDEDNIFNRLNIIKNRLLSHNIKVVYKDFKSILKDLNMLDIVDYENKLKDTREVLNFKTPLIARDDEINLIMENDKKIQNNNSKKVILIDGEEGLGRTSLLLEIEYRLKLKSREVYKVKMLKDNKNNLNSMKSILNSIIREHEDKSLDKYGSELVKIIPKLKDRYNILPSEYLSEEKERLRLYDRISNYIFDISDEPKYIIFDDLHYADDDTFNIINYMINNIENKSVIIVISYNSNILTRDETKVKQIEKWQFNKKIVNFKLLKFNLEETSLSIKNILGMNRKPMSFATFLYKETDGNPRYIEEIIKSLFVRKELFINQDGVWDYKASKYSKLYIPTNITEAIENQLTLLPEKLYKTIEKIAIFNTSISKNIINKMHYEVKSEGIDENIEKLVSIKLLEEKLEDWGYTYDIYNTQIKNYIYYNLSEEDRIALHEKASDILEEIYEKEDRNNIEELIYHLKMSKQYKKSIYYSINFAKSMQQLNINSQSMEIWKIAKDILKNIEPCEYNIEIYINLAKLYDKQGKKNKAIAYYEKALEISYDLNKFKVVVDIKNLLSDIYYRLSEYDKAINIIKNSKEVAYKINYIEGLLKSIILINKINFSIGVNKDILATSLKYLKISLENNSHHNTAELFNQLGIISFILGELEESKLYYKKSIFYYEKSKKVLQITKPINNLGLIYSENYEDMNKAMSYFEKGLQISKKFNSGYDMSHFYINISEIYIRKNKYDLAKNYIQSMMDIAFDIDEKTLIASSYIKFARIYLETGELMKVKPYIEELKVFHNKNLIFIEEIDDYLELSLLYYFILADYKKAENIANDIIAMHPNYNDINYFKATAIKFIIKYINNKSYDKIEFNNLIDMYNSINIKWNDRFFILLFGLVAVLKDDYNLAEILFDIDSKNSCKDCNDLIKNMKNLIENSIENNLEELKSTYIKFEDLNISLLKLITSKIIAKKYFENGIHYDSANYYLIFIESFYKISSKFKEQKIKINIAKSFRVNEVIKKLYIIKNLMNNDFKNENKLTFNSYFDIDKYQELFSDENFLTLVSNQYADSCIMDIIDIDDLLSNLGSDYLKNINLIVRYAMREVLASRAMVSLYDEKKDEFNTIMNRGIEDLDKVKNIIDRLLHSNSNGYIQYSKEPWENRENNLSQNITAILFLPIYSKINSSTFITNDRRNKNNDLKKIKGYIYLDTDKLFNKFNEVNYIKIKKLINLISLNIDNYNFKVLSSIDKLTNVYTRKYMENIYSELYNKCRKENLIFSVLMLDIDKFKQVNDTYGHPTGDMILEKIGNILRKQLRNTDIIARYGGEEFIIILPSTNKENAYLVAEKLRKSIASSKLLNKSGDITVSIGISQYPEDGQFREEIIENADKALYNAKNRNRNMSVKWDKSLEDFSQTLDKLAGIITGNIVHDHRMVLAIVEIIELIKKNISKQNKYFLLLGRLIEITESKKGSLILLNDQKQISRTYTRERFIDKWIDNSKINEDIINRVIENKAGEYLIDWEQTDDIDNITLSPNWKSIVITPAILNGDIKALIKLSVPIKEKEFDYNTYNYVNIISNIISAII